MPSHFADALPPTIPTTEPDVLTAGDSWQWDATYSDYPASSGWSLSYRLVGSEALDISTTASGSVFQVRVLPAVTADIAAGSYKLIGYVTDGTDRFEVFRGTVEVRTDYATAATATTHAETVLAAIETVLSGRVTNDLEHFQINGRMVTKIPAVELMRLRGFYAAMVWRERYRKLGPSVSMTFDA